MGNVKLKKLLGVLLGAFIGFFFFINTIACLVYCLIKKKYKLGAVVFLLCVGQLVMIIAMGSGPNEKQLADINLFSNQLNKELSKMELTKTNLIKFGEFKVVMNKHLEKVTVDSNNIDGDLAGLFRKISTRNLSQAQNKLLDEYIVNSFEIYQQGLDNINTPENKYGNANLSIKDQRKLEVLTKEFARGSYTSEVGENGLLVLFFGLSYFLTFLLTVYFYRNIFINDQVDTSASDQFSNRYSAFNDNANLVDNDQFSTILSDVTEKETKVETPKIISFKINMESQDKIAELAGVGAIQAMNIVNERRDNGYFKNMDDFRRRINLSERVHNGLAAQLDFSMPEERRGGKGRVVEF